ncbi:MAG: hypothetical protein H6Q70_225 [Firmicutes bacterium]|nr:hypothetical protein [Bacillota bacterium]
MTQCGTLFVIGVCGSVKQGRMFESYALIGTEYLVAHFLSYEVLHLIIGKVF